MNLLLVLIIIASNIALTASVFRCQDESGKLRKSSRWFAGIVMALSIMMGLFIGLRKRKELVANARVAFNNVTKM